MTILLTYIAIVTHFMCNVNKKEVVTTSFQTVDKALLLQGFAIVGAAFLI